MYSKQKLEKSWRCYETETGYLGKVPVGAQPGDLVYMLHQCKVPVVLRKVPGRDYFELIGTSFVVGMMNGELAEFVNAPDAPRHRVELR